MCVICGLLFFGKPRIYQKLGVIPYGLWGITRHSLYQIIFEEIKVFKPVYIEKLRSLTFI